MQNEMPKLKDFAKRYVDCMVSATTTENEMEALKRERAGLIKIHGLEVRRHVKIEQSRHYQKHKRKTITVYKKVDQGLLTMAREYAKPRMGKGRTSTLLNDMDKKFGVSVTNAAILAESKETIHTGNSCPLCCGTVEHVDEIRLYPDAGMVLYKGMVFGFSKSEALLIERLHKYYPEVVSIDRLMDAITNIRSSTEEIPFESILRTHVYRINRLLNGTGIAIKASWGVGYRMEITR